MLHAPYEDELLEDDDDELLDDEAEEDDELLDEEDEEDDELLDDDDDDDEASATLHSARKTIENILHFRCCVSFHSKRPIQT